MKVVPNLSMENFWNEIRDKYPRAYLLFGKWINEYKESVDWDRLFVNGSMEKKSERTFTGGKFVVHASRCVKFHNLPYEMQLGVVFRFIVETSTDKFGEYDMQAYVGHREDEVEALRGEFEQIESVL